MKIQLDTFNDIAQDSLQCTLKLYQELLNMCDKLLKHLDEIRIDDGATQLFVDVNRAESAQKAAFASTAVINLKALSEVMKAS